MEPRFFQRDKRWLVMYDKNDPLCRGDYVWIEKRNGTKSIVKIQDEVLVGAKQTGAFKYYLMQDVTNLHEAGYYLVSVLDRVLYSDGTWREMEIVE